VSNGWISPKDDADWLDDTWINDDDLFPSFAKLGNRGEPSEQRIRAWVRGRGLLRNESRNPTGNRMNIRDFRREVLCVRQMLVLYEAIETEDPKVLERLPAAGDDNWKNTLSTEIEERSSRDAPVPSLIEARNLLGEVLLDKIRGVSPSFAVSPSDPNSLKFRQGWYCPDLLSAIYLSFYLFITGSSGPARFCEWCGGPITSGPKHKEYCSDSCRSGAHKRKRRGQQSRSSAPPKGDRLP